MKMIIVLDKICLVGVIIASLSIGYSAGVKITEAKYSAEAANNNM